MHNDHSFARGCVAQVLEELFVSGMPCLYLLPPSCHGLVVFA